MNTRAYTFLIASLLLASGATGQNLVERYVFNSAGQSDFLGSIELYFSVGEPVIGEGTYADVGFIQPDDSLLFLSSGTDSPRLADLTVFPNPMLGGVRVKSPVELKEIVVVNFVGQEIRRLPVSGKEVVFDIGDIAAGIYYLVCYDPENSIVSSVRVVKI